MAYNFVVPERDQLYLLPPSLTDWLKEDHLAFFVLDCVEEMDLTAFGLPPVDRCPVYWGKPSSVSVKTL
jgi:hypothetical protein